MSCLLCHGQCRCLTAEFGRCLCVGCVQVRDSKTFFLTLWNYILKAKVEKLQAYGFKPTRPILTVWEGGSSQLQTVRTVITGPAYCCVQNSGLLWLLAEECKNGVNLQWCLVHSCSFFMHKSKYYWSVCYLCFPSPRFLREKRYCIKVNWVFVSGLGNSNNNWLWRQSSPDMDWEDSSFLFFSICYIFLCTASGK